MLKTVIHDHLVSSGVSSFKLISDDGSENAGPVKELVDSTNNPIITHLIAQQDIEFSNSMIEAANKQLKYAYLYRRDIADYNALVNYLPQAIEDFNNRPHSVLEGLTPEEVSNGKTVDKNLFLQRAVAGKIERIVENKKIKCCYYSF